MFSSLLFPPFLGRLASNFFPLGWRERGGSGLATLQPTQPAKLHCGGIFPAFLLLARAARHNGGSDLVYIRRA
jgi:hypothetical protein